MKNLMPSLSIVTLTLAVSSLAACGKTNASVVKDSATAPATSTPTPTAAIYTCFTEFDDSSLQATPLWTQSFTADPTKPTPVKFGVSPGDASYYANVGLNKPDGVYAQIFNDSGKMTDTAVFQAGTSLAILAQPSQTATLSLRCSVN